MTTPVAMSDCPTEETLAAFIDGRLDSPARHVIVEHLAACGDCRDVVIAASDFQATADVRDVPAAVVGRFPRSVLAAAVAFAAAAILVVLFGPLLRERLWRNDGGIERLVEASDAREAYRPADARLTGGFGYKPRKRALRGTATPEVDWSVSSEAGRIRDRAKKARTRENLLDLASAHFVMGEFDEAVQIYESLLMQGPGPRSLGERIATSDDARLLTDLAAAYCGRAFARDRRTDLLLSSDSAARAMALRPSPEAAWNRAIALEALELRSDALAAWSRYLELDGDSAWATEARARVRELSTPPPTSSWERDRAGSGPESTGR